MYAFSNAVNSMHSEDIKLLMKQASGKSMISFAGGMPNNDLFPVNQIKFYRRKDMKYTLFLKFYFY